MNVTSDGMASRIAAVEGVSNEPRPLGEPLKVRAPNSGNPIPELLRMVSNKVSSRVFEGWAEVWDKYRQQSQLEAADATAQRMAEAPQEALALFDRLIACAADGSQHGVGYASGSAWEAGERLGQLVHERSPAGQALSHAYFKEMLVLVGHLEPDVRRQLDKAIDHEPRCKALQALLKLVVNVQRFRPSGTG